jgi:hypothetical protein
MHPLTNSSLFPLIKSNWRQILGREERGATIGADFIPRKYLVKGDTQATVDQYTEDRRRSSVNSNEFVKLRPKCERFLDQKRPKPSYTCTATPCDIIVCESLRPTAVPLRVTVFVL